MSISIYNEHGMRETVETETYPGKAYNEEMVDDRDSASRDIPYKYI
jgi:hypothetical protein